MSNGNDGEFQENSKDGLFMFAKLKAGLYGPEAPLPMGGYKSLSLRAWTSLVDVGLSVFQLSVAVVWRRYGYPYRVYSL